MKLLKPIYEYSEQITEYRDAFYMLMNNHMAVVPYKILILSMNGLKKVRKQELGEKLLANRVPSSQF